jgi:hypothetical protein
MIVLISPSPEAPVRQDLPSPGVLCRRLNKSREKYGLCFWVKWRRRYKEGPEATLEGETWSLSVLVPPRLLLWLTVLLQVKN